MALRGAAVRGAGGVVLGRRSGGFAGLVADSGAGDIEVREEEPCLRCHPHFIEWLIQAQMLCGVLAFMYAFEQR